MKLTARAIASRHCWLSSISLGTGGASAAGPAKTAEAAPSTRQIAPPNADHRRNVHVRMLVMAASPIGENISYRGTHCSATPRILKALQPATQTAGGPAHLPGACGHRRNGDG
jgi:hypothetical protein